MDEPEGKTGTSTSSMTAIMRRNFTSLKNLPYQTLETMLLMLSAYFEHDRKRDLSERRLMNLVDLDTLVTKQLIPGFEQSGQMNFTIRDKLKALQRMPIELDNFIQDKQQYFKGALEDISAQIAILPNALQNMTGGLMDPIANLSEFFDGSFDDQVNVTKYFTMIRDESSSFQKSDNKSIKALYTSLSQLIRAWKELQDRREDTLTALLADCDNLMNQIRAIDFAALIDLLKSSRDQSECLNDDYAVFLVGCTGAGKSTLLQFLGGSTFKVETVDGAVREHYKPVIPPGNPDLEKFITSPFGRSETSTVNCYPITYNDQKAWFVDTPGLGDTEGHVKQIANVVGIVQALQRCKKVKVVFCVSDYDMANRMKQQGFI